VKVDTDLLLQQKKKLKKLWPELYHGRISF